jgi:hypothetical protein
MEKSELNNIIAEKYNQISKIEDEIKELFVNYANKNTILSKDDLVKSSTFNNKDIIFRCIGEYDYQLNIETIIVYCEVVSSNSDKIKLGDIYAISEKYLTKI